MRSSSILVNVTVVAVSLFLCVISQANTTEQDWPDGKPRIKTSFYKDGTKAKISYYRQDGSLQQMETFDTEGDKLSVSYYGPNGRLADGADGWAAMKWTYNDGEIASETYYGEDGKPQERKLYNSLGDLVSKQYVGDKELPAEEFNPIPTLAGETISYYDENGKSEGTTTAVTW